jgi:16S rRNA (uracil1498-N3)-methyltransferase
MPRLYLPGPLHAGCCELPPASARHLQALRLRNGDALTLFDGGGGEWQARLLQAPARVELLQHVDVERELPWDVTIAAGMPANERMDWLVEKATELGVACIQPLMTERSVLRLQGERAQRRAAHWQGVAQAACEQCGRNRVPEVALALNLRDWLVGLGTPAADELRCMLAAPRQGEAQGVAEWRAGLAAVRRLRVLSGPEGGFGPDEILAAERAGFRALSLGPRVLRAETAPLALLAALAG